MSDAIAPPSSRSDGLTEGPIEVALIGETTPTRNGYYVRVTSVSFTGAGMRVRLTFFKDKKRIHHMDLTSEIARDLAPILREAALLGAKR